jgi:hypothetical protein
VVAIADDLPFVRKRRNLAGVIGALIMAMGWLILRSSTGDPPQSDAFLSWDAVSGASSYRVYWDVDSGAPYRFNDDVGSVTEVEAADIDGLVDGTFYFSVVAIDDQGFEGTKATEVGSVVVSGRDTACDSTVSSGANLATTISGAAAGAYICLNTGNYSTGVTINNISKSPRVTLRALTTANITGTLAFTGSTSGITIDLGGGTLNGIDFTGATIHDIAVRQFAQTGLILAEGPTNADPNLVVEDFTADDLNIDDTGQFAIGTEESSGVSETPRLIVRRGYIDGGCADGVRVGAPILVEDTTFIRKQVGEDASCDPGGPAEAHTDAIQFLAANSTGTIIRRNYFECNSQALVAFDSVDAALIENNLFFPGASDACGGAGVVNRRSSQIELYSDDSSIVRYNTVVRIDATYSAIELNSKPGDNDGVNTEVYDNIANEIDVVAGAATAAVNTHNCVRSGSSPNVVETPTYVDNPSPTTFAGALLVAGGCKGEGQGGIDPGIQFRNLAAPANFAHN